MKTHTRSSKLKGRKVHGFLRRMSTKAGRKVLKSRRRKGRKRLTTV